jgi:XTP/dITP diphosphohydrolase
MLVLGTNNKKKGEELRDLLAPHGLQLKTLADFPDAIDVVEDGDSFAANAALKATQQARHLGQWVIGEDSGLSVDALDGRPGIYSARFAGENATDPENNERLLLELEGVPLEKRTAHYVCHITLSDPEGQIHVDCEDTCRGRIRFEPAGSAGFGYDPLFEVIEYHQTFGQLGATVKSLLSHRARAMRQFLPQLLRVLG